MKSDISVFLRFDSQIYEEQLSTFRVQYFGFAALQKINRTKLFSLLYILMAFGSLLQVEKKFVIYFFIICF